MKLLRMLGEDREVLSGYTASFPLPASATTTYELPICSVVSRQRVTAVRLSPAAAVTGVITNNFTLTVNRYNSAGALTGVVATVNFTNAKNFVQWGVLDMGALTNATLAIGDTLTLSKTVTGVPTIVCPAVSVA